MVLIIVLKIVRMVRRGITDIRLLLLLLLSLLKLMYMLVLCVLLVNLLLVMKPPRIHHGMLCHCGLSETMAVGLDWRNVPPGVRPSSNYLIHLHRPRMVSEI